MWVADGGGEKEEEEQEEENGTACLIGMLLGGPPLHVHFAILDAKARNQPRLSFCRGLIRSRSDDC